ncbi:MAG: serine/threonine-protein kinase, partial [Pirellulaceae bacterium]|nr:serine/threonine-protein kinase [Pirellulaceae bacterium]
MPACPSDEALLAIMPGQLSGPAVDSIQAHLSTCSNCQSRITTLKRRQSATGKVSPEGAGAAPNAVEASVGQSPARAIVDSADSPLGRAAVDSSHRGTVALTTLVKVPATPPRYLADYELLRPIGRGGMGVVYKAVHTRLQRTVAIKMLSHYDDAQGVAAARLQREVIAAGRVKHPNIVFATDAGEAGGIEYLVMEYVEGLDLGKLVALVGPLPAADACEVVRQAALGLAHIEACHLVHRDLKPSNLMLADDGTVKILDLGLARMRRQTWDDEESTRSGYLLGTADYVAPEQVTDPHAADVRSDMYSLGCTFYKLLTGRAPFGGGDRKTVTSKLFAHRHVEPTPIRELRPETPDAIVDVVTRLLEKAPAARLGRPQELAAALAPLAVGSDLKALLTLACERADLDGIPSPSPSRTPPQPDAPTPPPGETPTPRRRALKQQSAAAGHRRTWLIAGGACLVLVGLVAVAFWARSKRVTLPSVIADATDPPGPQPTSLDVLP